jgi:molecular chaperone DnaK (HSP70)
LHAKISLSTKDKAVIPVNHRGHRLAVKVDRELFEDLTKDLVQQCEDTSNLVLEKAGMAWSELDDVLLVGGSTRMPMIRNMLIRLSNKEPVAGVNPDECVALGAALAGVFRHRPDHPALKEKREERETRAKTVKREIADNRAPAREPRGAVIGLAYGGHVAEEAVRAAREASEAAEAAASGDGFPETSPEVATEIDRDGLPAVAIEDVTTHPLGIIVLDKNRQERVVELIPERTRLPYEYKGRFAYAYENMTAVRVEVTEGAGGSRDEVTVIGKVELTGLPPRPRGTPIEVLYRYGVDQILKVQVVDVESGVSREVAIRFAGGMDQEQLRSARSRNRGIDVG